MYVRGERWVFQRFHIIYCNELSDSTYNVIRYERRKKYTKQAIKCPIHRQRKAANGSVLYLVHKYPSPFNSINSMLLCDILQAMKYNLLKRTLYTVMGYFDVRRPKSIICFKKVSVVHHDHSGRRSTNISPKCLILLDAE